MARKFSFDLYRLNLVDMDDLFMVGRTAVIRSDEGIVELLEAACAPEHDVTQETKSAEFKWSIRYFSEYQVPERRRHLCSVLLARSVISKDGLIVMDDGIATGTSSSFPPLASTMSIFFDLSRHLVAVEHTGDLAPTAWKDFIEKILQRAAISIGKSTGVSLEPVPEENGILGLFRSFDVLTRLKVTLRIPNPELTRYTKMIYEELVDGDIREYTQDMKNSRGISKSETSRPFATAVLAAQGYKSGEVQMEGIRDGSFDKVLSGSNAARGSIPMLREFVRGMHATAKTKEAKATLIAIIAEIDKIHPKDQPNET